MGETLDVYRQTVELDAVEDLERDIALPRGVVRFKSREGESREEGSRYLGEFVSYEGDRSEPMTVKEVFEEAKYLEDGPHADVELNIGPEDAATYLEEEAYSLRLVLISADPNTAIDDAGLAIAGMMETEMGEEDYGEFLHDKHEKYREAVADTRPPEA